MGGSNFGRHIAVILRMSSEDIESAQDRPDCLVRLNISRLEIPARHRENLPKNEETGDG